MLKFIHDRLLAVIFLLIIFAIAIVIKKCDEPRVKREKEKYEEQVKRNQKKLYYPKFKDGYWHTYSAKLNGAEGWIREKEECKDQYKDYKIVVVYHFDVQNEARRFKGRLIVHKKGEKKNFEIRFRCFQPDYRVGNWLINNN